MVTWIDASNNTCANYTTTEECTLDASFVQNLNRALVNGIIDIVYAGPEVACCSCGGGNYSANPGPQGIVIH